jgi:hypothetical protein
MPSGMDNEVETEGNWEHFQEIVGFKPRKRKSSEHEGVAGSSEMQKLEADKGEEDERRVNDTTTLRTPSSHGTRKMRSSPMFSAAAQRCVPFSSVCHRAPWLILFHIFFYSACSTVALIHPLCRLVICLVTSPSAQRLLLARRLLSPGAPKTRPTELIMSVSLTFCAITSASNQINDETHSSIPVEFAFEIGSGLLTEVRRLQSLLGERDMKEEKDDLEKSVESLRTALRQQEQSTLLNLWALAYILFQTNSRRKIGISK